MTEVGQSNRTRSKGAGRKEEDVHSRRRAKSPKIIGAMAHRRTEFPVVRPLGANPNSPHIHRDESHCRIHRRRCHHLQGRRFDAHRDRCIDAARRIDGQRGGPAHPTGHPGRAILEDLARSVAVRAPCAHRSARCGGATGFRWCRRTIRTAAGRRPCGRTGMVHHVDRSADRAARHTDHRQRPNHWHRRDRQRAAR